MPSFQQTAAPPSAISGRRTSLKTEKLLYTMDSTTIKLFDYILKGVGWHPKSDKKKGGL